MSFRRCRSWLACCSLLLGACFDDAPPGDFRVVPAAAPRFAGDECPDLSGLAVEPAMLSFASEIVDRTAPEAHGVPMVLAFRRGVTHQEMWWVVPRPALLQFANALQARDPGRYARWRSLVLRGTLPGDRAWDMNGYLKELATLGPPARLFAGVVHYGCKAGWGQVRPFGVQPSSEGFTQREVWLARDARGDLLVRDMKWRMKQVHLWGDAGSFFRVGNSSTWQRVRTVDPGSVEAVTDAELPGALPAARPAVPVPVTTPATTRRPCRGAPDLLDALSQRVAAYMPDGVTLVAFQPERASPPASEPRPVTCERVVAVMQLEATSAALLMRLQDALRRDDEVQRVEVAWTAMGGRMVGQQLRVVLQ